MLLFLFLATSLDRASIAPKRFGDRNTAFAIHFFSIFTFAAKQTAP